MRNFLVGLGLLTMACSGCSVDLMSPAGGAVRFTPSDTALNSYRWQYARLERCSGIKGDFNRVEWFYYPGTRRLPGSQRYGEWRWSHDIYLADSARREPLHVSHEILHDLLWTAGKGSGHPAKYFRELCGYEMNIPYAKNRFPDAP